MIKKSLNKINIINFIGLLIVSIGLFSGLYISYLGYSSTPMGDQWDELLISDISEKLFSQHNEHRIFISRIIFILDYFLDSGVGYINLAFVFIFQIGIFYIVIKQINKILPKIYWADWLLFVGFCTTVFFDGFQFENFVSGFQNGFTGVYFFGILAIFLFGKNNWSFQEKILSSSAIAVISALTMANGLLVLPILVVMALLSRYPRKWILFLSALSIVEWSLYLFGYESVAGHGSPMEGIFSPFKVLQFVSSSTAAGFATNFITLFEFSGTSGALIRGGVAQYMGIGILIATICLFFRVYKSRNGNWIVLGGTCLFIIGSLLLTAIGRVGLVPNQEMPNRYGSISTSLLAITFGYLLFCSYSAKKRWSIILLRMILLGWIFVILSGQIKWYWVAEEFGLRKREAALALISSVNSDEVLHQIYPGVDRLLSISNQAKNLGVATYSNPASRNYDEKITLSHQKPLSDCGIELIKSSPELGVAKKSRLIITSPHDTDVSLMAVLDADSIVTGYLMPNLREDISRNIFSNRNGSLHLWAGYAPASDGLLRLIGYSASGEALCYSEIISKGAPFRVIESPPLGSSKHIEKLATTSSIVRNAWRGKDYYSVASGVSTLPGFYVVGSYLVSDLDSGDLVLSLHRGEKVWYRAEPNANKQSIKIVGMEENFAILKSNAKNWVLLDFSNPNLPEKFNVKFSDGGGGWGEWSAVGLQGT